MNADEIRNQNAGRSPPFDKGARWAKHLFQLSVALAAFGTGMYVTWAEAFPHGPFSRAIKTAGSVAAAWRQDMPLLKNWSFADVPPDSVEANRVRPLTENGLRASVVMTGGWWAFSEHCPEADGCLAVEYVGRAQTGNAWPFRADLLGPALGAGAPQMERVPGVTGVDVARPAYIVPFANGDLLATFIYNDWHYPVYAGMGRIGQDGRPLWFRNDYSHHEAHVGAGDTVWVPGLTLEESPFELPSGRTLQCSDGHVLLDRVHVVDGNGALVDSVSILDAFLASRWASKLFSNDVHPCDPFHLNSVSLVGEDVSGLPGVRSGDYVLSMRHMNAFAIIGRADQTVKRFVQGTFSATHSVKHLRGSKFVVFDNKGGYYGIHEGREALYSRVLLVDAANGEETVVFPKDPERWQGWYTPLGGHVSISHDHLRVVASFGLLGKAVEVCIATGEALAEFDLLHDMRDLGRFPADSATIRMDRQVFYAYQAPSPQTGSATVAPSSAASGDAAGHAGADQAACYPSA